MITQDSGDSALPPLRSLAHQTTKDLPVQLTSKVVVSMLLCGLSLSLAACGAPKSAAAVSESEMKKVRSSFANLKTGASTKDTLASFTAGNKVKLGSANIAGAAIEEWKVEAMREAKPRNDLFISFLYFCNDRLVDITDTRVDFRANPELVKQWAAGTK